MVVEEICKGVYSFVPDERSKNAIETMLKESRLPERALEDKYFHVLDFEIVGESEQERASLKHARDLIFRLILDDIDHSLIYLYGISGVGKTHLAYCAARSYLSAWRHVIFYQVSELLRELRNRIKDNSTEELYRMVETTELLILDDIGVQQATPFEREVLDTIVDFRYRNKKALIVTSNTLEISERILDRFKPNIVRLRGKSYRGRENAILDKINER